MKRVYGTAGRREITDLNMHEDSDWKKCGEENPAFTPVKQPETISQSLKIIKDAMSKIIHNGHSNSYDWNADPMQLTLIESYVFELIDEVIKKLDIKT